MATNINKNMEKLITVDELSAVIGMRPFTVRKKCRERKIPCYKIDGVYKFRMSEIEDWLESKKQGVIRDIRVDLVRQVKVR